jgi:hypothetical protein
MNEQTAPTVGEKIEGAIKVAEETVRHPLIKRLARFGFYAKGFLFIVVGILALMVALGQKGGELADPAGALETVAKLPYGRILLIFFIVGAIAHGAWNVLRGLADVDNAGKKWQGIVRRVIAVGVGIFYFGLALTALDILLADHDADRNGAIQRMLATILLALPLGALLMALIGLGVIGAGVSEFFSGVTGKYQENFKIRMLAEHQQWIISMLGVISFSARALILVMMGCFFIAAAFYYNPNEAAGVDRALAIIAQQSYGQILLFITSGGLLCHGILSLYEARFRRVA